MTPSSDEPGFWGYVATDTISDTYGRPDDQTTHQLFDEAGRVLPGDRGGQILPVPHAHVKVSVSCGPPRLQPPLTHHITLQGVHRAAATQPDPTLHHSTLRMNLTRGSNASGIGGPHYTEHPGSDSRAPLLTSAPTPAHDFSPSFSQHSLPFPACAASFGNS